MRRKLLAVAGAVLVLAGAGRAFAHHSFAATYDSTRRIEREGIVKEFIWRNPHSFLRIEVTDTAGAPETWTLEWGSVSQLSDARLTRTTLRPGDRILAIGEPARDPSSPRMLLREVRRPMDGWTWSGDVD
jgi:hypothetical protein